MNSNWLRITVLGNFVLLFAACSYADRPDLTQEAQPPITIPGPIHETPTEPKKDETQMPQSTPSFGMDASVKKAKENLAQRLSIEITQISLVEAKGVTWPNSSLGCPQPGMAYAEVLTSGYLILLNVDNKNFEYHAGKNSEVFLCENPTSPVPGMTGDT